MFRAYFKEKSDEKKPPKLAFGEPYKRNDNYILLMSG
jgi:hypothetical protein